MDKLQHSIVILGAGIIGLDVGLVLAERGFGKCITIVAEHMPGDTAVTFTSPWAGCNFSAISGSDANSLRWDELGYAHLAKLASEQSNTSFVKRTPSTELWDSTIPRDKIYFMSKYLEDFRVLPDNELPSGVKFAVSFTTMTINAPQHLLYLRQRLESQYGVRFMRRKLSHLDHAFLGPSTKLVFNCVGLSARNLPGVRDPKVFPTRGQIVLARAPMVTENIMRHGTNYETYVIPRPGSNGNVVLGGYMQKNNGDGSTYSEQADSILERTKALSTQVAKSPPEILAVFAGLRPSRRGRARIEKVDKILAGEPKVIVHNYGAGGAGFQAGYGMAIDAVSAADDILSRIATDMTVARL